MRSIDRRKLVVVLIAVMCLTALPGSSAAVGGGPVSSPANHTDFGAGDEPEPTVLENFSVGGSGDSASLSGPVGGITKGGGLVSSGDSISWPESSPSTSDSVINVTGVINKQPDTISLSDGTNNIDPQIHNSTTSATITASVPDDVDYYDNSDVGSTSSVGDSVTTTFSLSNARITNIRADVDDPDQGDNAWDIIVNGDTLETDLTAGFDSIIYDETNTFSDPTITYEMSNSAGSTVDFNYIRVQVTSNAGDATYTVDGNTYNLADGESATVTIADDSVIDVSNPEVSPGGSVDYTATTATRDPVVELNGDPSQQVSVDGPLGDGETVIKQVDNSWLESGDNTATVTLNNSSLPAGSPPMEARVSVQQPAQSARYVGAAYTGSSRSDGVGLDWSGDGSLDVTVQGWTGSEWVDARQVSTSETGNVVLDYAPIDYERTRVEIVAEDTVEIREESLQFYTSRPEIDESSAAPASGNSVSNSPVELSVNVSDADFGSIQSDSVTVEFYDASDDSSLGTDTISTGGTVTQTFDSPEGGSNSWYAVATDSYGNSATSSTFSFNAPSELRVYSEQQPGQLLTDVDDMTIEFYEQSASNPDNIESVEVVNGTADMEGLDTSTSFIAVANADGYANRRIFVDSLIRTQEIYLLNESADSVAVEYELEDFSGNYPQAETVMVIEKNINGEWTPIQGDFFGATGKFEAQLLRDTRHRMRVVNVETGEERVVGAFTPQASATETVTILPDGSIEVDRGLEQIHAQPAVGSIPAAQGAAFGVDIQEGDQEITSWDIEIVLIDESGETTLATRSGSGTGTETFSLDLTGEDGGTVMAVVDYQTPERSGTVRLSRAIRENYAGAQGLLGGLLDIGDGLGAGDDSGPSGASMMAALFISLLVTGGVARVSTSADVMGIAALMSVAGFAILGWLPMAALFASTVGFGAMMALRRGI